MTAFHLLAAAAASPTRLDPITLFLDADIVVQAVMAGLLLASIWSWMIILSVVLRLGRAGRASARYEAQFWKARDPVAFHGEHGGEDVPAARVVAAGLEEWQASAKGGKMDAQATRQRLASAMDSAVAAEGDRLSERLNFLATVGAVAPFVGLFGTVWGIMNSFFAIGTQQSSSLAVVAPGISEALFATAIGLFAAIPAVIAYNRFSHRIAALEAKLYRFSDRVHATLSRELDGR